MNTKSSIAPASMGDEFYPTPQKLVDKMLFGVDLTYVKTVLEPSAGTGDIVERLLEKDYLPWHGSDEQRFRNIRCVDCVEINPELRSILRYNYGEGRANEARTALSQLREKAETRDLTSEEKMAESYAARVRNFATSDVVHVVYDDFLKYEPFKEYDLIIMNPPFSEGDKHLIKAIELQKDGGSIICLLNAETIKNPYIYQRQQLRKLLDEYGASIEYIEDAFIDAERRTNVEVALVKISIPRRTVESEFYERMRKAERIDDEDFASASTEIDVTDYIKSAVAHFRVEVKAGMELIRQYRAFKPYMRSSFEEPNTGTILRLTDSCDRGYDEVSINGYASKTRLKYWRALLSNPKFIGKLTSKLQEEYRRKVDRLQEYDFNEFNIETLSVQIMSEVQRGIEEEIAAMFDRLSASHSWYGDDSTNRHYYDGWATNKAWKINKKVILPCYGVFSEWSGRPSEYEAFNVLSDIERIFNFFDGKMTADVDLAMTLKDNFAAGITRNIRCKFFEATFYKKGTVHIVFSDMELLERFNIYAARNRGWLPPSYGKKKYSNLTDDEKKVVDSFQGEAAYEKVVARADYYLSTAVSGYLADSELRTEGAKNEIQTD